MSNRIEHAEILSFLWLEGTRPASQLIEQTRKTIIQNHSGARRGFRHTLHLALNEAEALAWQTPFPHLFFPTLAEEKLRALEGWNGRQLFVWRRSEEMAFAA